MGLIPSAVTTAGAGTIMVTGGVMIGAGVVGYAICNFSGPDDIDSRKDHSLDFAAKLGKGFFAYIALGGIVVTAVPVIGLVVCAVAYKVFGN